MVKIPVFPRFRIPRKKKAKVNYFERKSSDNKDDKKFIEGFERDRHAFNIVRKFYLQKRGLTRDDWLKIVKNKKEYREQMGKIITLLETYPYMLGRGNEWAVQLRDVLELEGYKVEEALKFADMLKKKRGKDLKIATQVSYIQPSPGDDGHDNPDNTDNSDDSGNQDPPGRDDNPSWKRPQKVLEDRSAAKGIYGKVTAGGEAKKALIIHSGPESGRGATNDDGEFFQSVSHSGLYVVECRASGYKFVKENVSVTDDWSEVNFKLEKKDGSGGGFLHTTTANLNRTGVNFFQYLIPFIIVMAGVMISYLSGCPWLMAGFISLAVLFLLPEPFSFKELKDRGLNITLNVGESMWERDSKTGKIRKNKFWQNLKKSKGNTGLSTFRGLLKVTSICLFVAGIKFCMMPFQATLLIIVAFVGYFSMSTEVDKDRPSTAIESTIRFGILGCFVIPFWIFWSQFNSLSLGFIALAFFAVPPVYRSETDGQKDMMAAFSKFFFLAVMLLALFGSGVVTGFSMGPSWELHGALKVVFIYFWIICTVAGFFASAESRPPIGLFMLLVALIVYGMSSGVQDVGMGLFGPYFPDVYTGVMSIASPISDSFMSMSGTFGTAWKLLSDPVGYAQGMMNPTYGDDELSGMTGPLGIEIKSIELTPIQPFMPYTTTVTIQNRGASEASNILVNITALATWSAKSQGTGKEKMTLGDIGFVPMPENSYMEKVTCYDQYGMEITEQKDYNKITECSQKPSETDDGLSRLDIRPVMFETTEKGITCETINRYALRESRFREKWGIQFIPIIASVSYDYSMSATLDMNFISRDEWTRLTQYDEGFYTQQKQAATNTNSPAYLKIDTMAQPIREGTPFTVAIVLEEAEGSKGKIEDVYSIELTIPKGLVDNLEFCRPESNGEMKKGSFAKDERNSDGTLTYVWNNDPGRIAPISYILCRFRGIDIGGHASLSYLIQANATFRFSTEEETSTKVEWSGDAICCDRDSHCPDTDIMYCNPNTDRCEPKGTIEQEIAIFGSTDYCVIKQTENELCGAGDGQCTLDDQCMEGLKCTEATLNEETIKICCDPEDIETCGETYLDRVKLD